MKFNEEDFKTLYGEMPDEELRSLVRSELTELARRCYDAELTKRGLKTAPPPRVVRPVVAPAEVPEEIALESQAEPEEPTVREVESEEEEDLAAAGVFASRAEAIAARGRLQSAAIPAFLEDDTKDGRGFRLLVAASYVDQAREALEGAPRGAKR